MTIFNSKTLQDTITANSRFTIYNMFSDLYTYLKPDKQTEKSDINTKSNPGPSAPLAPLYLPNPINILNSWFNNRITNSIREQIDNPVSDGDFDTNPGTLANFSSETGLQQSEWTKIPNKSQLSQVEIATQAQTQSISPYPLTSRAHKFIVKKLHLNTPIDFVTNFMFAIEVDWPCDINLNNLFKSISLEILGMRVDRVESNQIPILQQLYKLDIKKYPNENKIYFPIPIECFVNSNGLLLSRMYQESDCPDEVQILFEFGEHVQLSDIKSIKLFYNGITILEPVRSRSFYDNKLPISFVDIGYRPKMYQDNLSPMELSLVMDKSNSKLLFINSTHGSNKKSALTTRLIENFSTGPDLIKPGNPGQVTKINTWYSRYVERFIIYFEDTKNLDILLGKLFDFVKFIADGQDIFTLDYSTIVSETKTLYPTLPDGVYVIEADRFGGCMGQRTQFEFTGLVSDRDGLQVHIVPQTVNFLGYETTETRGYCGRTGLFFIN